MSRTQAGVSFDSEVWKEFKSKYKNASHELENYMKWRLENPEQPLPEIFSADDIRTFNFNDASRWTVNYNDDKLQVSNSAHNVFYGSVDAASTDSATSYTASSSWKDIEIE